MSEVQLIHDVLKKACCPEDVFGVGTDPLAVYKKLVRSCHPDLHSEENAKEALQILNALRQEAETRIAAGDYGKKLPLPHCVPLELGKYKVQRKPTVGDVADLYIVEKYPLIVKVARSHDDNDLLRAEASALKLLAGITGPVKDGVPAIETFQVDGRRKREANVLTYFPGFYTAEQVHAKMTVDAQTGVWMFKRILSLLTWVHHFKLVHGAILPPHVLFYPDNDEGSTLARPGKNRFNDPRTHSIRLIDWCYSVDFTKRTRLSSWVPAWKDHYPPEVIAKTSIGPTTDLYMAAMLINYLSGTLPPALEKVLVKCLKPNPAERYQKASEVFEDWKYAAKVAFGEPQWHDFVFQEK